MCQGFNLRTFEALKIDMGLWGHYLRPIGGFNTWETGKALFLTQNPNA